MYQAETYIDPINKAENDTTWRVIVRKPLTVFFYKPEYMFIRIERGYFIVKLANKKAVNYWLSARNEGFKAFCDRKEIPIAVRPEW